MTQGILDYIDAIKVCDGVSGLDLKIEGTRENSGI